MTTVAAKKHGSRWTVVILLVVFLAPSIGGWAWFHYGSNFSQRHFGALYTPARPLDDVSMRDEDNRQIALSDFRGSWVLAYVGSGPCLDECRRQLDKITRVRLSQSKNIRRVSALYVSPNTVGDTADEIRAIFPTGTMAVLDRADIETLLGSMLREGQTPDDLMHQVYLIDPIGNLVLSYPADAEPSGMRKDLARLLRVSQIG
jgi:hypothetical protein